MELPTPEDLRDRRDTVGLTQAELAERADVSQPLIARIEGGDVDPRLSTLRGIVNALEAAESSLLRAKDLMNSPVVSVRPDTSTGEAVDLMTEKGYSQVPVVRDGTPQGLISLGDIIAPQGLISLGDIIDHSGDGGGELPVVKVMSEEQKTVEPDTLLDAFKTHLYHSDAVLVVDGGETVGIITETDLASYLS